MTRVLSVRVPGERLAALDRRARAAGVDRSTLVNGIIANALSQTPPAPRNRFRSGHLVGKFALGLGSTNAAIRAAFRSRREARR